MAGERGLGVQTVLANRISGKYPFSYAETPGGLLLLANGIDPMLAWNGLSVRADPAGVSSPATALELGGTGYGLITGRLIAYQRFIDALGNVSDLSPVSNAMDAGVDGLIEDVDYDRSTGVVTIKSSNHGLTGTETLLIADVEGLSLVNGLRTVVVADKDTLTVQSLTVTDGMYEQGGHWTLGVATVFYGAVPIPTEGKVVRRQILRNLAGNADTLYVDIDTTDLASTVFSSATQDEVLSSGEGVPLNYGESDLPFANSNGLPPSHKAVICSHKGRIFAASDVDYTDGHVETSFNNTHVVGVGTNWRSCFAGRLIYIGGSTVSYQIESVDEETQTLELTTLFQDAPRPYALYSIKPEPGERRLVYYSEPGTPESWPAYNAFAIPECNDQITGLVSLGQYLYVIERRHIHRFTFQADPADGVVFLSAQRGSLNNRTYVATEVGMFFLDEIGIHKFDGQESEPISMSIQNLFQSDGTTTVQVDWDSDQSLWHAAHDPVRDTIRWFVTMSGFDLPYHAISYNYRTDRWWIEQYPTAMTASTSATIGARRSLAGTDARRIVCLSEGSYDGVSGTGTLRGNPTSATETTIVDSSAEFEALEGGPISIVEGLGRGQHRIVAANTATEIEISQPWDVVPDETSVYQIGGVSWQWRSGWFRYIEDEDEKNRDVEVVFRPLIEPSTLDIQLYFDHSLMPNTWGRTIKQDGVRTIEGEPFITVELNATYGWARQRLAGHGDVYSFGYHFVAVELSGVQSGEPVRVSQVVLLGVEV
ncbi:hypothetical protein SAMN05444166_4238 [Singulisphaera sp. GP187]|uniref:hypothetical protein n=1 Tax=Singulisphaera sp. GP187 TaxID=1882752 RepID=UPI0009261263|nr:hypothetical protein [Singulisphaera sp. GP187]SIO38060.1 hypothetical protein SAMN05444166_4238 [Singulisphaera sp. GP187]